MARKRHDDGEGKGDEHPEDPRDGSVLSPRRRPGEPDHDVALRPRSFDEYVGQPALVDNLDVFVKSALKRGEALDHILFTGPPGLGKTTMAHVIARELGAKIHVTSGPAIDHKGVLAGLLTSLGERDVLFIDEIHRLSAVVQEYLYPAMEDYKFDVFIGEGAHARAVSMTLPRFTLLGATTRAGLLSDPLRKRFGYVATFSYYRTEDLQWIVERSARLLEIEIEPSGAREIARRARGTPRIANTLLRRVRDFAVVRGNGCVTMDMADHALKCMDVDALGLDALDRGYLRIILERFDGGPVGIEAVAASLGHERDTLEDFVEPYLVQEGFVARTPRGRKATSIAWEHLGLAPPRTSTGQGTLL
ncbi:MAG: Holliday junction branch migration DNA helicase RuvB [Deltaproteobacteria bacterium]|nr:Holliday junction branch migration DNA helicase RuvB [Deltaproteobacteria bacterium]